MQKGDDTKNLYKKKKQRIMPQIREQEHTHTHTHTHTEKQLSALEIINLHEKDLKWMIVKTIQDLGNKLEGKTDKV